MIDLWRNCREIVLRFIQTWRWMCNPRITSDFCCKSRKLSFSLPNFSFCILHNMLMNQGMIDESHIWLKKKTKSMCGYWQIFSDLSITVGSIQRHSCPLNTMFGVCFPPRLFLKRLNRSSGSVLVTIELENKCQLAKSNRLCYTFNWKYWYPWNYTKQKLIKSDEEWNQPRDHERFSAIVTCSYGKQTK